MSDDKPSIAELLRLERQMTRIGWRAKVGNFDKGHGHHITASAPHEHFADHCILISHLFHQRDAADMAGIAALRNAAPVLLEIAAAALAFYERSQTAEFEDDTRPARRALFAALAKVRP